MSKLNRPLIVLTAAAMAVAVAGGLVYARSEKASLSKSALAPLDFEPGVVHVHGLGVDPADGALYAATHSGLFRVPEAGKAVRVANRAQDTMGFAVVGPNQFLGSGHPDFREDDVRPPLLGLIESADAGHSWERKSLHGKADFHVLRRAHGRTYGYDSTSRTLMVSEDGRSWDRRARMLIGDFVVNPSNRDLLLAITEKGLEQSLDGGSSFHKITAPQGISLLSWTSEGLFGVCSDGGVHRMRPGRATWDEVGKVPAEPEAFLVDERNGSEVLYVATRTAGILISTDGGRSFTTRYKDQ